VTWRPRAKSTISSTRTASRASPIALRGSGSPTSAEATRTPAVLPLIAFIFLVALGVDYNIFLVARAREETVRHGSDDGIGTTTMLASMVS